MIKKLNRKTLQLSAAVSTGVLVADAAYANNFGSIAKNITTSIAQLPGLLSALSYMFGILLGVLGVMKIKDHVENPQQTALKDGAIRLAAGGALFALPIIYEAMFETIGDGASAKTAKLHAVTFATK
jgi:hypothetical protein